MIRIPPAFFYSVNSVNYVEKNPIISVRIQTVPQCSLKSELTHLQRQLSSPGILEWPRCWIRFRSRFSEIVIVNL